ESLAEADTTGQGKGGGATGGTQEQVKVLLALIPGEVIAAHSVLWALFEGSSKAPAPSAITIWIFLAAEVVGCFIWLWAMRKERNEPPALFQIFCGLWAFVAWVVSNPLPVRLLFPSFDLRIGAGIALISALIIAGLARVLGAKRA